MLLESGNLMSMTFNLISKNLVKHHSRNLLCRLRRKWFSVLNQLVLLWRKKTARVISEESESKPKSRQTTEGSIQENCINVDFSINVFLTSALNFFGSINSSEAGIPWDAQFKGSPSFLRSMRSKHLVPTLCLWLKLCQTT